MVTNIKNKVMQISNSTLIKGAFILGFSGVLCKIIGVFYRVPLTSIVGSVGMGIYGLIFPIYSLLLVVSSSAFPVAMSKLISKNLSENKYALVKKIIKVSFTFLILLALFLTALVIIFSKQIALLLGAGESYLGLITIAPSILLVAFICVYRGIFQGYNNMSPTATSQLIEQVVKLILGLFFAFVLMPLGVAFAVAGAMFGITLSEAFALIYLKIKYSSFEFDLSSKIDTTKYKTIDVLKMLIKTILPITLSGIIIPVFLVIESFLCVNLLTFFGQNGESAVSDFGLYSGVVNTLINVPIVLLTAIAISSIPIISQKFAKSDAEAVSENASKCINLCLLLAVPCVLVFSIFPSQIISIIYPTLNQSEIYMASKMLALASSSALSLGLYYATTIVLQAVDKFYFPIINVLIASVFRTLLYCILIKFYGIYALPISSTISYLIMIAVNIVYLRKNVKLKSLAPLKIFVYSLVFIVFCLILYCGLYDALGKYALLLGGGTCVIFYLYFGINTLSTNSASN